MNDRPVVPCNGQSAQMQLSALRRRAGEGSLKRFAQMYLPAHFALAPSAMHEELFTLLQRGSEERGVRLAVAAPRGHAKSTIVSLAYVLWCICYGKEPFIYLVSHTLDQAADNLSHIKRELQDNPRLLEDFPEVCEPLSGAARAGASASPLRWRKEEIITRNGVKVTALGTEKKLRGRRHNQHRPTLIILDDVENEDEVRSADQRRHKLEWFNKSLMKAGSSITNVLVVGTILHYDAMLAGLINPSTGIGWTARKYQAITSWSEHPELWAQWELIYANAEQFQGRSGSAAAREFFMQHAQLMLQGTSVLWPQREDYYSLMETRLIEGRASFNSEKQNDPINPEDCLFMESDFKFWDDQYGSVDELIAMCVASGGGYQIYGACDPSMGKLGKHSDDSAIVSLLKDNTTNVLYVLDADIRRRKPDSIIESVIEYHRIREYHCFGMETNQFQQFLSDELKRRAREAGVHINVQDVTHTSDKLGRIQKLQAHLSSGQLRLCRRHVVLLDQLRQFPMGAHDDGPDALELAVRISQVVPVTISAGCWSDEDEWIDPLDDPRMWAPI